MHYKNNGPVAINDNGIDHRMDVITYIVEIVKMQLRANIALDRSENAAPKTVAFPPTYRLSIERGINYM
jgi:hypothetical protein